MDEPVLKIDALDIGYDGHVIVSEFSLSVAENEFVCLLGPSGCGKTTVLRAIAGFVPAMAGRIVLEGVDVTAAPPEWRDVGIVFQNYALFPTMTAFENIAFGLRVAKRPQAEIAERVEAIARTAGIFEHLGRKPANLSGGQQQRVAIARALVTGSRVLLFDEPLSNLDAKVRITMRKEIKRLQAEIGFTAIFVTHDQEEALSMADTIVVLDQGRIAQVGSGRDLYTRPASPFIMQFIGAADELAPDLAKSLAGIADDKRCFVRHEDVLIGPSGAGTAEGSVNDVEFLGAQSRVDIDLEGASLSTIVTGVDLPEVGDRVSVSLRPNSVHVFARGAS